MQTFELTFRSLEEKGFRALARDFLMSLAQYPKDLNFLGVSFPNFLAEHEKSTEFMFLEDLAKLDFFLHSLYFGIMEKENFLYNCSEKSSFAIYMILFDDEIEERCYFLLKRNRGKVSIHPQKINKNRK